MIVVVVGGWIIYFCEAEQRFLLLFPEKEDGRPTGFTIRCVCSFPEKNQKGTLCEAESRLVSVW
jgi:hypothetical protein